MLADTTQRRAALPIDAGGSVEPLPIAVIIVCRNALNALRRTLDGLDRLADPRLRVIVIDGASTDGTPDFLRARAGTFFHSRSEPDCGIYDAMNKGWQQAPDDAYVLYLGAGDQLLQVPDDAALRGGGGRPRPIVLGHVTIGTQPFFSRWSAEMRLRNTAHHQGLLVHKSVSPQPPFDSTLRVYADWDFNLRLRQRGVPAHGIETFRAFAEPGGASWHHDLQEIRLVAARHGGAVVGWLAWALNRVSLWRRQRRGV